MSCDDYQHPDHSDKLGNLNRVIGQLEGVKRMIEERRYCPDIITQLRAARSATRTVEAELLRTHLQCCVTDAISSGDKAQQSEKIDELVTLFKRYDEA